MTTAFHEQTMEVPSFAPPWLPRAIQWLTWVAWVVLRGSSGSKHEKHRMHRLGSEGHFQDSCAQDGGMVSGTTVTPSQVVHLLMQRSDTKCRPEPCILQLNASSLTLNPKPCRPPRTPTSSARCPRRLAAGLPWRCERMANMENSII